MVAVSRKDREITRQDIQRVLDAAKSAALPSDREILHAVPQEFIVDEQGGIDDPLGMLGTRLEVMVHLVTCNVTRSRDPAHLRQPGRHRGGRDGLRAARDGRGRALAGRARARRAAGGHRRRHDRVRPLLRGRDPVQRRAPIGAGHFTNDLAMVLRTPFAEAERIKTKQGCCLPSMVTDDEGIAVPTVAGGTSRIVPKRELCEILQPRAEELFNLLREDLLKHASDEGLRGGVVLTGGGAQLDGLLELAEQIFDAGVRYGLPRGLGGLVDVISSPTWATASGLLLYAQAGRGESGARCRRRPDSACAA